MMCNLYHKHLDIPKHMDWLSAFVTTKSLHWIKTEKQTLYTNKTVSIVKKKIQEKFFKEIKMLRSPKFLQSSPQFLHPPIPPSHPPQLQNIPTLTPFPIIKQCFKFSRRELAIGSSSSLLLLLGSQNLEPFFQSKALAEENIADTNINEGQEENSNLLF